LVWRVAGRGGIQLLGRLQGDLVVLWRRSGVEVVVLIMVMVVRMVVVVEVGLPPPSDAQRYATGNGAYHTQEEQGDAASHRYAYRRGLQCVTTILAAGTA